MKYDSNNLEYSVPSLGNAIDSSLVTTFEDFNISIFSSMTARYSSWPSKHEPVLHSRVLLDVATIVAINKIVIAKEFIP